MNVQHSKYGDQQDTSLLLHDIYIKKKEIFVLNLYFTVLYL
jgi:hypothetical protein